MVPTLCYYGVSFPEQLLELCGILLECGALRGGRPDDREQSQEYEQERCQAEHVERWLSEPFFLRSRTDISCVGLGYDA